MILRIYETLYFFLDRKDYISDSSDYKRRFNIIILEENARNSIRSWCIPGMKSKDKTVFSFFFHRVKIDEHNNPFAMLKSLKAFNNRKKVWREALCLNRHPSRSPRPGQRKEMWKVCASRNAKTLNTQTLVLNQ